MPKFLELTQDAEHRVGSDEVGNGPWAGPITVCAVLAPASWQVEGLKDSKRFSKREALHKVATRVREDTECYYVLANATPQEIDMLGFQQALLNAHCTAIRACISMLGHKDTVTVVVDGVLKLPLEFPYNCIPRAEDKYKHVAAASIVAKDSRDSYMEDMGKEYPQYGFENHVGYGTAEHRSRLRKFGACPLHRMSVTPVRDIMFERGDLTNDNTVATSSKGRMRERL